MFQFKSHFCDRLTDHFIICKNTKLHWMRFQVSNYPRTGHFCGIVQRTVWKPFFLNSEAYFNRDVKMQTLTTIELGLCIVQFLESFLVRYRNVLRAHSFKEVEEIHTL